MAPRTAIVKAGGKTLRNAEKVSEGNDGQGSVRGMLPKRLPMVSIGH